MYVCKCLIQLLVCEHGGKHRIAYKVEYTSNMRGKDWSKGKKGSGRKEIRENERRCQP